MEVNLFLVLNPLLAVLNPWLVVLDPWLVVLNPLLVVLNPWLVVLDRFYSHSGPSKFFLEASHSDLRFWGGKRLRLTFF